MILIAKKNRNYYVKILYRDCWRLELLDNVVVVFKGP